MTKTKTKESLDIAALAERVRALLVDLPCKVVQLPRAMAPALLLVFKEDEQGTTTYAQLSERQARVYYSSRGGYTITNGAGYGEADTRTFGESPDLDKIAASIAEVARARAEQIRKNDQKTAALRIAYETDDKTSAKIAAYFGEDRVAYKYSYTKDDLFVEPEHGTGRVKVKLRALPLTAVCWPEEIAATILVLRETQEKLAAFGRSTEARS